MPRPREAPVFFIDHCLGTEKVAQRLRQAGVEARVLVEAGFSADSNDVEWLPVVAAKGWAVLTKDKRPVRSFGQRPRRRRHRRRAGSSPPANDPSVEPTRAPVHRDRQCSRRRDAD